MNVIPPIYQIARSSPTATACGAKSTCAAAACAQGLRSSFIPHPNAPAGIAVRTSRDIMADPASPRSIWVAGSRLKVDQIYRIWPFRPFGKNSPG